MHENYCLLAVEGPHDQAAVAKIKAAGNFLDSLDNAHTKHFRPFDKEKALIASIVSILKPGMANTPSIAQDKWISNQTIDAVSDIRLLHKFLKDLLNLN